MIGSDNVNTEPSPSRLWTLISPPIWPAKRRQMASPSPIPPVGCRAPGPICSPSSKIRSMSPAAMRRQRGVSHHQLGGIEDYVERIADVVVDGTEQRGLGPARLLDPALLGLGLRRGHLQALVRQLQLGSPLADQALEVGLVLGQSRLGALALGDVAIDADITTV